MTSQPQNTDTAMLDTATATVGSAHEKRESINWNPVARPNIHCRPHATLAHPSLVVVAQAQQEEAGLEERQARLRSCHWLVFQDHHVQGLRLQEGTKKDKPPATLVEDSYTSPWKV